jgi:hypothetical protein
MLGREPSCIASHNLHLTLAHSIQYILIKEARPHLVHLRQSTDARKWASLVPMSGIAERERVGESFLDVTLLFHFVVRIILCSTVYSLLVVLTHILPSHESRPVFPLKLSVHGAAVLRSTAGSICATRGLLLKLSKDIPMPHRDRTPCNTGVVVAAASRTTLRQVRGKSSLISGVSVRTPFCYTT